MAVQRKAPANARNPRARNAATPLVFIGHVLRCVFPAAAEGVTARQDVRRQARAEVRRRPAPNAGRAAWPVPKRMPKQPNPDAPGQCAQKPLRSGGRSRRGQVDGRVAKTALKRLVRCFQGHGDRCDPACGGIGREQKGRTQNTRVAGYRAFKRLARRCTDRRLVVIRLPRRNADHRAEDQNYHQAE